MTTSRIRIAVTSDDAGGLDARVGAHFGRCAHYTFVDVEDGRVVEVRAIDNPFAGGHQPGQVPAFIASQEAHVLLTGGIGRRAIDFFEQLGIAVGAGNTGSTVRQAVEAWMAGGAGGIEPCTGHEGGHQDQDHPRQPHGPGPHGGGATS
jgi:predicted Fe-Mo cluster-binding NifX family protein